MVREILKIYTDNGLGDNNPTFKGIELTEYSAKFTRMGMPSLTATLKWPTPLDDEWTRKEYVTLRGDRFYIRHTPTGKKDTNDTRYSHEIEFTSEFAEILGNIYFEDYVPADGHNSTYDKPCSNNSKFTFYGTISEFIDRMNCALLKSGTGDSVLNSKTDLTTFNTVAGDGFCVMLDPYGAGSQYDPDKSYEFSWEDKTLWEAIIEGYNITEIPFERRGRRIIFGAVPNVVEHKFEYGHDNELISIAKKNANAQIINRITMYGGSGNIPYYYPNETEYGHITVVAMPGNKVLSASNVVLGRNNTMLSNIREGEYIRLWKGMVQGLSVNVYNDSFYTGFKDIANLAHTNPDTPQKYPYGDTYIENTWFVRTTFTQSRGSEARFTGLFGSIWTVDEGPAIVRNLIPAVDIYDLRDLGDNTSKKHHCKKNADGTFDLGYLPPSTYEITLSIGFWKRSVVDMFFMVHKVEVTSVESDRYYWQVGEKKFDSLSKLGIGLNIDMTESMVGDGFGWTASGRMPFQTSLVPPKYRNSEGASRFYNALDDTYTDPDTGDKYVFPNPYVPDMPSEYIYHDEDIIPTIEGIHNAVQRTDADGIPVTDENGQPVYQLFGEIADIAYDADDNDLLITEATAEQDKNDSLKYEHSYFYIRLNIFNGPYGFDLFDHALQSDPMTIQMTDGPCNGCKFKIQAAKMPNEYGIEIWKNPVIVDDNVATGVISEDKITEANLDQTQQNTQTHSIWICVQKDAETFGKIMPNKANNYAPAIGDKFNIININLPDEYIYTAEKRLEEEGIRYMADNNEDKFTFEISASRIFFAENPDILAQIDEYSKIKLIYDGTEYEQYISQLSIDCKESEVLPNIGLDLADELSVGQSFTMQVAERAASLIANPYTMGGALGSGGGLSVTAADKRYLNKQREDRTPYKLSTDTAFEIGSFVSGASGGIFLHDVEAGQTYIEVDKLRVRMKAIFEELEIAKVSTIGGKFIITPGGGLTISFVEETTNSYRCYFKAKEEDKGAKCRFVVGDQVQCHEFNIQNGTTRNASNRYYWRLVTAVNNDESYIELSKTDRDNAYEMPSDAPQVGDTIVQLGNRNDATRQSAIILSTVDAFAPCVTLFNGIDHYTLDNKAVVEYGVDKTKNPPRPFFHCYGDMYVGNKDGSRYLKYTPEEGLVVRGSISSVSTIVDDDGNETGLGDYINDTMQDRIDELQKQIDGVVETWNGSVDPTKINEPASGWDTELDKQAHIGDVYFNIGAYDPTDNPNAGHAWRWYYTSPTDYGWVEIADSDAVRALQLAQMSITDTDVLYKQTDSPTDSPATPAVNTSGTITDLKGWSTDAPEWQDGKYMWQTTYVKKGDGSATFSDPTCISGSRGPQGVKGDGGYTWIRYADNAQGGGISNNPTGKAYIGFAYNKTSAIESNNPADYTWSEIKGEQGVQGPVGPDGKTYYTWIQYSDNANGVPMYQQPNANTKYIGIAVNKESQTEGNNPADYTWSLFKGADGTNITISSQSVKYSTNHGATQPADSTFTLNAVPTLSAGQYLWSMTTVTYSNGQSTKSYAVSRIGADGTSATITATSVTYAKTSNATQPADTAFAYTTIGAVGLGPGDYLWTKTEVTYSDGTSTKSYAVSRIGSDGEDGLPGAAGEDGKTTYVHFAYANSANGATGFSTTYFNGALYVGTCTDYNQTDPTTYTSYEWARLKGEDGTAAKIVVVNADATAFVYSDDFTTLVGPTSINLSATLQGTTGYQWSYKSAGASAFTNISGGTGSTLSVAATSTTYFPTAVRSCTFRCTSGGVYDEVTLVKVSSGSNGEDGQNAKMSLLGLKDFLKLNEYYPDKATLKYDTDGNPYIYAAQTYLYSMAQSNPDLITFGITFKENTQYCFKAKCDIEGITSSPSAGWFFGFEYPDGTTSYKRITPAATPQEGEVISTAGKSIKRLRFTYASGQWVNIRAVSVTEGTDVPDGYPMARIDQIGDDAYTVMLTNESHIFEGDTEKAVAASTESTVIAYKGATQVAATIGTITGMPTGMTVAISNNGTTSAKFTVSVTTALTTKQGTLNVPVTVDGKTFAQVFSWSLSLKGKDGRGITAVVEEYAIHTSGTTAPADSDFSTAIQTMTDSKPYLWNREKTTYSDNTSETTTAICIGVKGQNGVDGATVVSVTNWYLASADASGVTTSTAGWTTDASATAATMTADAPYLWNYEVTEWSKGADTQTDPHVVGKFGKDGAAPRITEQYYLSTSSTQLLGDTWHDQKPAWIAGCYYWTRSKIYYSDDDIEYTDPICVTPENGTSVLAQYSATGGSNASEWHPSYMTGDVWMRTSSDGGQNWTPAIRITGADYAPNLLLGSKEGYVFTGADYSANTSYSSEVNSEGFLEYTIEALVAVSGRQYRYLTVTNKFAEYFKEDETYTFSAEVKSTAAGYVSIDSRVPGGTNSKKIYAYFPDTGEQWQRVSGTVKMAGLSSNTASLMAIGFSGGAPVNSTATVRKICLTKGISAAYVPAESEMTGQDGPWRKFQWAKNTSATTAPTSGWQDAPMTASAGEYVWMRSGLVVPPATNVASGAWGAATRITGDKGAKGDPGDPASPIYMLDLSNEVMGILCNSSGTVTGQYPTSQASVWEGSTKLTSGITYSIAQTDGVSATVTTAGVVTPSALTKDNATIVVQAVVGVITLQSTITLYKVKAGANGASAVVYSIEPSVDNITKSIDGTLSATSVTCSVYKTTGNSARVLTSEKTLTYQRIANGTADASGTLTHASGTSAAVNILADTEAVIFELKDGNTLLDRERVPVLTDASDLEIGGRNLLRDSGRTVQNGNYSMADYPLAVTPEDGEAHTFTLWGELAATKTKFVIYNSGGNLSLADLKKVTDGKYQAVFTWRHTVGSIVAFDTFVRVYAFTNAQTGVSTIEKVKLEKGNIGTDWTPAPEDIENRVDTFDYLKAALKGNTAIDGGLVLSSLIKLGEGVITGDKATITTVRAGMNGIYGNSPRTIASWWGGDMVDRFNSSNATISPMPQNAANALVRMDGSAYFSQGNIGFNADGSGWLGHKTNGINFGADGSMTFASGIKIAGGSDTLQSLVNFMVGMQGIFIPEKSNGAVTDWNDTNNIARIKVSKGLYSTGFISARGLNSSGGSSGGSNFNLMRTWPTSAPPSTTIDALAANLGWELYQNKLNKYSSAGVLEVARYIDFHTINNGVIGTEDYTVRLDAGTASTGRVFTFPTTGGVVATEAFVTGKGYLTGITKAQVEGVLTGNIATHTHSQYLTSHQSLANYYTKSEADGRFLKLSGGTMANTNVVTNLNADLVDGKHAGNASGNIPVSNGTVSTNLYAQYASNLVARVMSATDDFNTLANFDAAKSSGFVACNLNSLNTFEGIGVYSTLVNFGYNLRTFQIQSNANSDVNNRLKWRTVVNNGANAPVQYTFGNWYSIAFTDSNVASATKLNTGSNTYSAWGQTFWQNGVPNSISGNMTNVGNISPSGNGANNLGTLNSRWNVIFAQAVCVLSSGLYPMTEDGNYSDSTLIRNGSIELSYSTPYIDFHYNNSASDYTSRIIEELSGQLKIDSIIHNTNGIYSDSYISARGCNTSSDERKKNIVGPFHISLDRIASAPAVIFRWKSDDKMDVGSIAQYWHGVNPLLAPEDPDGYLSLQYGKTALLGLITVADEIKTLKAEVKRLQDKILTLQTFK